MKKIYLVKSLAIITLISALSIFCFQNAYSQISQTFTANGTFVVPAGVTSIKVEAWGGGAGGSTGYGGGGGGAYAGNFALTVTAGNSYTVTVGNGGTALNNGNASSFGSLVIAAGGTHNAGGTVANSTGTIRFAGGNGGAPSSGNGGSGGGGSGGAGGAGGVGATTTNNTGAAGGAAGIAGPGTAGAAGGVGGNSGSGGGTGIIPGGGGGENGNGGGGSGSGARGQVIVTYIQPYLAQFSALNAGSSTWCAGEVRSINLTVKNIGSATWVSNAGSGVNFSYYWNTQGRDANPRQLPFTGAGLAPGQSQVITVSVTALTAGTYTLNFDLVKENACWFQDNVTNCSGPGNTVFTSPSITVTALPVATFSYTATPYCRNAANPSPTFSGGGTAGTFSSTAGLVFVSAATGQINLSASTPGTYTVTNTIAASGGCGAVTATSPITITALPVATFSYTATPYCQNASNPSPTFSGGGTAGTFSSTAGLVFVSATTGQINLSASTPGTYTVTNTIAASGGCGAVTATSPITITALPVATFSYTATPYCQNASNPSPTFSGGGTAGTFSSTAGLVFVSAATGQINLSASTPGTYTVTNTIAASGGCGAVTATSPITITALPVATFSYTATPYCQNGTNPSPTFSGGGVAGTFSSTAGLVFVSAATGKINLSASTPGTYTVTNTIAAANGCGVVTASSPVTITALPIATFNYAGTPYCQNAANPSPTFSGGGVAGTFSSTAGLVFVSATTGQINLSASTPGTYTVTNTIAASGGCGLVSATSSVTITALPIATFNYSATPYCQDGTNPSPTFTGGGVAGTFSSTAGLSIDAVTGQVNLSASTPGAYSVTNTIAASGGCAIVTATSNITINQPVSITTNPSPLTQKVCATTTVNYSVTATGTGLTYQWLLNGNPLSNTVRITGTTTANLQITGVTSAEAGTYSVIVSGLSPCTSLTSDTAHLDVDQRAVFSAQPVTPQTICQGQPYTISATATGTVSTAVWNYNGSFYANSAVSGNVYSLTIPAVVPVDAGNYQLVLDDGTTGCTASNSNIAVLNVSVTSVGGSVTADATVCYGTNSGTLTLAGYTGTIVRWESSIDNFTTITNIANTTTSLTYTNLTQTTQYRAVVQSGVCPSTNSSAATITVNANLVSGSVASDQTICYNSAPAAFTSSTLPTGGTGSYTYQWQSSPDNSTWTNIPGATNATYTSIALSATTYFRRTATSGTCGTVSSNVITVTVNPNLVAGTVAASQTICYNTAPAAFTSSTLPSGGTGTYTYQWQSAAALAGPWTDIAGATATTYTSVALTATTYFRRNETSGSCGTVSSNVLTITVYVNLVGGSVGSDQIICYNTAPAGFTNIITPTGASGVYTYQWQSSPDNINWTNIASATSSTYTSGALTATTYFRRTATSGTCGTVNSNFITVTVNANLVAGSVGSNQTICYNTAPAAFTSTTLPTGGTGTYTYQWQSSPNGTTGWTNVASGGTGTSYAPGVLTATTYFRRTATSGSCGTVNSNVITVTVNPNLVAGTVAASQTICYNTAPAAFTSSTLPTGGTGTYTYQWQSSPDNTNWTDIAGATATTYSAGSLTTTTYYRRNETSGTCGTVSSNVLTITVYANLVSGSVGSDQTICYNTAPAAFTNVAAPTGGSGTYTYQWQSSPDNTNWTNIPSATSSTYTSGALTATTYFRRTATSGTCGTVNSNFITVTVNPNLVAGSVGSNQTICYNTIPAPFTSTTLPIGGTGTYTYQWQSSPNGTTGWTNVASGGTGTTYAPGVLTATTYYRRQETSGTCGTVSSNVITITVYAVLTGGTVATTPQTICYNTAPSPFTSSALPTGADGVYTYQWQSSPDNSTWTNIAGATATTYTAGALTANIYFRRNASSTTCGTTASSNVITVIVRANLVAGTIGSNQTICYNTAPAQFTNVASPTGGTGTYTYQWQSSTDNITFTNIASATSPTYTSGALTVMTYFRRNETSGTCGTVSSNVLTININPLPTISPAATAAAKCFSAGAQTSTLTYSTVTNSPTTYSINYNAAANAAGFVNVVNAALPVSPITINIAAGTVPGTYTGSLTVKNANGCLSSPGINFTITINALPTPSLTNNPASPVCANTNVTYTTDAGQTNYIWTFTGNAGTDYTLVSGGNNTSNTAVVSWLTAGNKTVTVNYSNGSTCTAVTPTSNTINVLAVPSGTLNETDNSGVANNDKIICAGSSATFTFSTANLGSYVFKVNGVIKQTGTSNVFSSSTLNDQDKITVDVANGNNCGATFGPITISVTPLPVPTISVSKNPICQGDTVTITTTLAGGTNYTLKINGSAITSNTTGIFTSATLNNNDVATVDVTNSNGCIGTSNSITMVVNAIPTGSLTATATTICQGNSITFTAGGGSQYQFYVNGTITQAFSATATFISSTLSNGDIVSVDVKNGSGCISTATKAISVTVNPPPSGTFTATENSGTPNDYKICSGAPVTFIFSTTGYQTYNFKINHVSKQSSSSNTFITTALAAGDTVTVDITTGSTCAASFTAPAVTINPSPSGTLTPSKNPICAGDNVTFTATSDPNFTNYNFKVNGNPVQNGATNTYSTTSFVNGDVVTVDVTNNSGCISTFGPVTMQVNALPGGTLVPKENSGTPDDGSICPGVTIVFTAPTGFANYDFILNGVTVQSGISNTYPNSTLVNGDSVQVAVKNSGGCIGLLNTIKVKVNPLPVVQPITGTFNVCVNNTTALADATTPGVWSSLNPGIATVTSSGVVKGISAGNATINYTVTDANGCSTTVSQVVTVHDLPTPTLSGPNPICPNTTGTYTTESGQSNYVWTFTGGTKVSGGTSTDSTITITWDQPGTRTVNVNYSNSFGCTGATSVTVTSNSGTPVNLNGTSPVCLNSNGIYHTNAAMSNYTWTAVGGTVVAGGTTNNATIQWTTAGIDTVKVNFTDVNGCIASAPAVLPVTVNALPTASISADTTVCATAGTQPLVTFTGANGALPYTFTYTINGGSNQTVTTTSGNSVSVAVPTNSGGSFVYALVSVSDANPCSQPQSGNATVTVTAPPAATISYAGTPYCTSASPASVTQTGTSGGTYSSTSGLSINSANGTITPATSTPGIYTVTYSIVTGGACGTYTTTTSVTITAAPSATIAYSGGPYCTTASPVNVTRTGTSGGTYSAAAGLSIDVNTGTITPSTSTAGTYTVTYTIAATGGCAVFTTTASVTITAAPSATIAYGSGSFCTSSAPVNVTRTGTPGGNYSSTAGLTLNTSTGIITPSSSTAGSYKVTYSIAPSGGCAAFSTTANVSISAAATAVAGTPIATCSNYGPVNITAGSSATNQSSVLWTSSGTGTFANANSLTLATYNPSAADITAGTVTLTLTANGNAPCGSATSTKIVTISAPPPAFIITPASATICQGNVQSLTATASTPTTGTTGPVSSGTINLAIPDPYTDFNPPFIHPGSVTSTIPVLGIPAGAIITSVSVNFNITHPYDHDLVLNIQAPNGNILNMINQDGPNPGNGSSNINTTNFTNTTISSASVTPVSGNATFTGTWAPDAANNVGAPNASNVGTFTSLYSTPNGNWIFNAADLVGCHGRFCPFSGTNYTGTLNNWSITINYTIPNSPLPVTWSPTTDLYTDPAATTAYRGTSLTTVYANPSTSGNKTYTATATNASNCSTSETIALTVNPTPTVTISADYCSVAGKVVLTATSAPAATSYIWSTGSTFDTTQVNVSGIYNVTAFQASGCPGKASISVSQELVVNGDFSAGGLSPQTTAGFGFTSDYAFHPDVPGLVPAGQGELYDDSGNNGYSITPSGQNVHIDFWGHDHTTGTGNFMAVNGHGNTLVVWKETVNVLPNTTYYFSAWAMSMNSGGNYAQLRFSVNGQLVGTTAVLANHGESAGSPDNWTQFYGTWTSGPTTTSAVIYINDLQAALTGNDFGLDDISFATLSTFINLVSAPGTDAQTVCINSPIANIVYNVGNGNASGPTVTGLPAGVTSAYASNYLTISGTPTIGGNYTYTITTTGCNPQSVTGTITAQEQEITLSSGSASPTVCINNAVSIGYTLSGTATNASVSGLTGATTTLSNSVFTINWTPTSAGSYPYKVITSGTCAPDTVIGTITVQSQIITLSSAPATTNQTVCINSGITNIQYAIGGTGTGATVSGLPNGVTGKYQSGIFIISGTPTQSGTFNYTVTTSGTCAPGATATGTIIVTPGASLTLTSPAGTDAQAVCQNNAITDITYAVGNATSASITSGALPAGVTGGYSGGVFKITGTPTVNGTFNYTITTSGGCAFDTKSGTITVNGINLTSGVASPSLCANTPMTNIVYTISGTVTSVTPTGLPTGVTGSLSGNVYTISGTPNVAPGSYPYTITSTGSCASLTASGTITITPGPNGGTLASALLCGGSSGNITLSGQVGTIQGWQSSIDGGTTWNALPPNTTITQTYTNITQPTQYRVAVSSSGCSIAYSTVGSLSIYNYWTGGTSTDWNTASNWSGNLVPTTTCANVYIPAGITYQPTLGSGTATITNLIIYPGGQLTVSGATLQIAGTINNTGTFIASNGTLEFNGTSPQTITAGLQNNNVKDVIISNSSAGGVTLGGQLDVYDAITYGASGTTLNTGGFLTLKSNAATTARIGDLTGYNITGAVTVERYINTGVGHGKAWEFLATPTQGQTVNASWMEGNAPGGNSKPGFGTQITSPTGAGFDRYSLNPSMKYYDPAAPLGFTGIANTSIPLYDQRGYMLFVRGDRSVDGSTVTAPTPTVLRSKGSLFIGPITIAVGANAFGSIGNPFASAIDMTKVMGDRTGVLPANDNFFTVWDPYATGSYGVGAYITFSKDPVSGNYIGTPGSATNNNIQSGQAFFVQNTGASAYNMVFKEPSKTIGSNVTFFRPMGTSARIAQLRTDLYSATNVLADGTLQQFSDDYSNAVDGMDGRKFFNSSENLYIKSGGKNLIVERRKMPVEQDTIFFNLTSVKVENYHFEFTASNLSSAGVDGFVEDSYLKTRTPLNMEGKTELNFAVTNAAGSYAANRFMIVFKTATGPLPVTFVSVKAYPKNADVAVEWKVDNESNMKQYEVEKSIDGSRFNKTATLVAMNTGAGTYNWLDQHATPGYNYYRIRSIDMNGKVDYTQVVKVLIQLITPEITIHPNPITNGVINLHLINQPAGKYFIRMLNPLGQLILSKQVTHAEGTTIEPIQWNYNLAHGTYQLQITKPNGELKVIKVMY